eukprot:TRINITY_DN17055_c0_g3_i1.p1 TRINITY_DN17055_c0_g3~~TRINITY_DN17055_c0_g3_i1.p1  ORF type:complete len:204 (-),score=18.70 TRINITY_DN17055_c0_g3_i1:218-829(-)
MVQISCTETIQRLFLFFMLIAGGSIIAVSIIVENPPSSVLLYVMLSIGALQVVTAAFGFVSECCGKCCKRLFLTFYVLAWLPLVGITFYMFIKFDDVVERIHKRMESQDLQLLKERLNVIKFVFAAIVAVELLGMIFGGLRYCCMQDDISERDRIEQKRTRIGSLVQLRKDIENNKEKETEYQRLKKQMHQKYGKPGDYANKL